MYVTGEINAKRRREDWTIATGTTKKENKNFQEGGGGFQTI